MIFSSKDFQYSLFYQVPFVNRSIYGVAITSVVVYHCNSKDFTTSGSVGVPSQTC